MEKFLKKPEKIFILIALFWGFLFVFLTPPFQGSDETSHLYKIYGFTQGSFVFQKYTTVNPKDTSKNLTFYGQILPYGLIRASNENREITFYPEKKTSFQETLNISRIPLDKDNKVFIAHPVTQYSPLAYMPAVVVIWFMTLFNAAPFSILIAGRLCALFVYLLCGYWAVRLCPFKKWLLMTVLLIPTALFQSSILGTDALSFGLIILLYAYCLNLAYNSRIDKITGIHNIVFFILSLYICVCKFTYLPLMFLYLIIPEYKFSSVKEKTLKFILMFLITVFVSFGLVAVHVYLSRGLVSYSTTIPAGESLKFIFSHPFEYLFMIFNTLFKYFGYYLNGIIGLFGWSDTFLPFWSVCLYCAALIYSAVINFEKDILNPALKDKMVLAVCTVFCLLLVVTSCFTVFEPDMKNHIINWIQGRYLLPVVPAILLLFSNKKLYFNSCMSKVFLVVVTNFVLFVSLVTILKRYYF